MHFLLIIDIYVNLRLLLLLAPTACLEFMAFTVAAAADVCALLIIFLLYDPAIPVLSLINSLVYSLFLSLFLLAITLLIIGRT